MYTRVRDEGIRFHVAAKQSSMKNSLNACVLTTKKIVLYLISGTEPRACPLIRVQEFQEFITEHNRQKCIIHKYNDITTNQTSFIINIITYQQFNYMYIQKESVRGILIKLWCIVVSLNSSSLAMLYCCIVEQLIIGYVVQLYR